MPDVTHASLRDQLAGERDRLRSQLRQMGHGPDALDFDGGFADSSQVTAERGEIEVLTGTLQETLEELDHALAKFDDGTYGSCESCGQPIPAARLEAMPAARLCITCTSKRR